MANAIYLKYTIARDMDTKKRWEKKINLLYAKYINDELDKEIVNLPPPTDNVLEGEYHIGDVLYNGKLTGRTFGIREKEWTRHILVTGQTGSGKTNLLYNMILELHRHGKKVLVLDWKSEYRELLQAKEIENDLLIFGVGGSKIPSIQYNMLIPPKGVYLKEWINILADILGDSLFLGEGVFTLLRRGLLQIYERYGCFDEEPPKRWPMIKELLAWIDEYKGEAREKDWKSSTKRAIEAICFGEFSHVVNVPEQSFPLERLLDENVIIELGERNTAEKKLFVNALICWLFLYRKYNRPRGGFDQAIVMEEAHNILLKQSMTKGQEALLDKAIREIRSFGISVIIADQHPSLLSLPAIGDTATTITLYLKDAHDVDAIGAAMLMDRDTKINIGKLPVGNAISKLSERWFNPFLIRIPRLIQAKGLITDEQILNMMASRGFSPLSSQQRREREYWAGKQPQKTYDERSIPQKSETGETPDLSPEEFKMLLDVNERPFVGLDSRYKMLQRSKAKGIAVRDKLIEKGLIELAKEQIGMNVIGLLDLTEKGRLYLAEKGVKIMAVSFTEGGIVHRYCVHLLQGYYEERGYAVEIEHQAGNDHYVDLMVKKDGLPTAVEVETGKSDPLGTIRKDIETGFNQVICVAINFNVYHRIAEELQKAALDSKEKVIIVCIDQYIKKQQV